jgi:hypothetical protein
MIRLLSYAAAAALLVLTGLVHGLWTQRWHNSAEPAILAARLDRVPWTIADWEGQEVPLDERQFARGQVAGWLSRRYVQRQTGAEVSVLILCGSVGPIAVHTPDICYTEAGYQLSAPPARRRLEAAGDTRSMDFLTGDFSKERAGTGQQMRIWWSWSADGSWTAPPNPRWTFAGRPALYKLYLIYGSPAPPTKPLGQDPAAGFLGVFLPELNNCLFPRS